MRPSQFALKIFLVVCVLAFSLMWVLVRLGFVGPSREALMHFECISNLKRLGTALSAYDEINGSLPPLYVADADGTPMHSWRVLLLPYLGYTDLHARYDFREPWNGPNNRLLAREMPEEYGCLLSGASPGMAAYVAVVGPETAWPGTRTLTMRDCIDGSSASLLLIEVSNSDIHWMEPRDVTSSQAIRDLHTNKVSAIRCNHPNGIPAVLAYGYLRQLPEDLSAELLEAYLTIDGGETFWKDPQTGKHVIQYRSDSPNEQTSPSQP